MSIRSELTALRSGRLWLVLAACATTTGGVLSAYSYIAPIMAAAGTSVLLLAIWLLASPQSASSPAGTART